MDVQYMYANDGDLGSWSESLRVLAATLRHARRT